MAGLGARNGSGGVASIGRGLGKPRENCRFPAPSGCGPAVSGGFDYIVVGAGSAGSVLAARLSAGGAARVLVLEAGGRDRSPWIHLPIGYGKAYYDGRINWKYTTEPVPGLGGRTSYWPRGKVVGGSSSINAMVWARGLACDYDRWQALGATGWGWDAVAPVYRRIERFSRGGDAVRGGAGPVPVRDIADEVHPLCRNWLAAAGQAGLPVTGDYNGAKPEGAALYQITTEGGFRASAARAYLKPALKRRNLALVTRAHVTGLVFDGGRVVGVDYVRGGRRQRAMAAREVILAAGAVNTPQILMLSGLGPGAHLREMGIDVVADLSAVGQHLQDHVGVDFHYRSRVPTLNQLLRPWLGRLRVGLQYLMTRRGPLSLSINQGGGFVKTGAGLAAPDLQLYFSPVSYTRAPAGKRPMMLPDPFAGFLIGFNTCRPESRGEITLASPDPFAAPAIRPNYFGARADLDHAVAGCRLVRRLAAAPALAEVIAAEISPGPQAADDAALAAHVRATAWTVFHACGTARMGRDAAASVVDPRLRVHGVPGLRIADASVFPAVTSGNTNAPVIMVAERAAEFIIEDNAP